MARRSLPRQRYTSPVSFADHDDVRLWAGELPPSFVMCRDLGHTWKPYTVRFDRELNSYERVLRCPRCQTERSQSMSMSGLILSNHYTYPDGYQVPAGSGRIDQQGRGIIRITTTLASLESMNQPKGK